MTEASLDYSGLLLTGVCGKNIDRKKTAIRCKESYKKNEIIRKNNIGVLRTLLESLWDLLDFLLAIFFPYSFHTLGLQGLACYATICSPLERNRCLQEIFRFFTTQYSFHIPSQLWSQGSRKNPQELRKDSSKFRKVLAGVSCFLAGESCFLARSLR